jgi:hypothetical protein
MKRALFALALGLAACGGSGTAHVGLGARAGTAASTAAAAPNQRAQPLDLKNGIIVTRLRVVLSEVKLETGPGSGDVELKTAPLLIDLLQPDLESGTPREVDLADVQAATYRELKFKIHKPALSDPGVSLDNGLFWMASENASVIVDGTIDAKPFTFKSAVDAQQELEGSFALGDGSHYVTLNFDPSGWFGGSGAARLDPNVESNRSQIENYIQHSFEAFQDDDHDGHRDHD